MRQDSELEMVLKLRQQSPSEFNSLAPELKLKALEYESARRGSSEIKIVKSHARQQPFNLRCAHGNQGLRIENGLIKVRLEHDGKPCDFEGSLDDLDRERFAHMTDEQAQAHLDKLTAWLEKRSGKIAA